MPLFATPFPAIDPVLVSVGPFVVRWYALAYIGGLMLGWKLCVRLAQQGFLWGQRTPPSLALLDDMILFAALGVVLGGRIGYVLFYNLDYFIAHPETILSVWQGGMSFHGGLAGCALGLAISARRHREAVSGMFDVAATVAPIGLFLGRIANFINGELWGRVTDVSWAVVFPLGGPLPRHPSQLYEAGLEGLLLGLLLIIAVRRGALKRPWLVSGLFGTGYGLARIVSEFFREPDPQLGFLVGGATMGMLLSLPLVLLGLGLTIRALRHRHESPLP
jgi:phosphatidylglycerol:prolipoprotein diacylglycerol transferase